MNPIGQLPDDEDVEIVYPAKVVNDKWHESGARMIVSVFFMLFVLALVTSPCWGFALLVWASK